MSTTVAEALVQPQSPAYRRGCLFYLRRGLKWFGIGIIALVLLGAIYQAVAVELDNRAYAPRGQLYTVNGRKMHLVCMGEGSPAVILQSGATADSLWWYRVQNQLATKTRVCAYDRPGMGWSEPVSGSRDPLTINSELHALLEQANVPTSYIMAGHSYGAILTRVYAEQYPDEVAGIVLVDSQLVTPKHFANQSEVDQNQSYWNVVGAVGSALTRLGLTRVTLMTTFQGAGYPAEIVPELTGLQARNQVFDAYYAENGPAFPLLQEASADAENLDDLPVIILWASQTHDMNQSNPNLAGLTDELSTYSFNTATRIVEGADHGSIIGNEQYAQQVTDAVLDVIEAAEIGEPLAQ